MTNKFEEFLDSSGLEMQILGRKPLPRGTQFKVKLQYKTRSWAGYVWSNIAGEQPTLRGVMDTLLWHANSGMEETLESYLDQYEEEDETPAEAKKRYASAVKDYKEISALLGADYETFLSMWFAHN